jgi:hypothetical protein
MARGNLVIWSSRHLVIAAGAIALTLDDPAPEGSEALVVFALP